MSHVEVGQKVYRVSYEGDVYSAEVVAFTAERITVTEGGDTFTYRRSRSRWFASPLEALADEIARLEDKAATLRDRINRLYERHLGGAS